MYIVNLFMALLSSMLVPIFPLWIVEEVDVSASFVFFIIAIIGIGSAVLNVIIGSITDKIGKRKLILEISLILSCLRGILYGFFPYIGVIIAASWLTQISSGSLPYAILADKIKENKEDDKQGLITSTVRTSVSIGYILGPLVGITIISFISYSTFFIMYGILYLVIFLLVRFLIKDSDSFKKQKSAKSIEKLKKKNFPLIISISIVVIVLFSGNIAVRPLMALYLNEISVKWVIGAVFAIGPIFEIIMFPLVGILNDRIGTKKTLILGSIGQIIYFLLLSFTDNIVLIIVIQVLGTFYVAVLFTSLMIYVQNSFDDRFGFSSSLYFSSMSVSRVISNALLGTLLLTWGYNVGFFVLAVIAAIGLILIVLLETKQNPEFRR